MSDLSAPQPRTWQAQWIGRANARLGSWYGKLFPAPHFRREFAVAGPVRRATLHACGVGYQDLHLNGQAVSDHVLDPLVTQFDQRLRYVSHDVTAALRTGANVLGVILGNGWYNCHTTEVWHFDKASWRDYPKLLLELEIELADGSAQVIASDLDWQVADGPITFDGLRNGEHYDARLELPGWAAPGYDASAWQPVELVPGPGGLLEPQTSPPIKVMETLAPVAVKEIEPGKVVYDLGVNIAGWAQLRVSGPAGTEITLRYAEKLLENGDIDQANINSFVKSGDCQTDRYTLKGGGEEVWEPRFTYHGFQYVQVTGLPQPATLDMLRGRVVHTSFETIGSLSSSSDTLNRLQACTVRSFKGNFVGIPTDCPHREKNGWTGDAQLAAETGLMNFAVASSYEQWLDSIADTQRPSGQLPGIVPSTGWGYNWGSGPAWDSAFVLIPWYIYLYTGSKAAIERHYEGIRRYVDYCATMATGHVVGDNFGLGDWCPVQGGSVAPPALTSTAYYYNHVSLLSTFAGLTGRESDRLDYASLAAKIKAAFNARFYHGDGVYGGGEPTSLGCALYQGLVEPAEMPKVVELLASKVEANGAKVDFGILGAKYVPRALADHGHVELAYRLISQPEFPGWAHWLSLGATTLWESWEGGSSQNHIMFGDISAWMYQYLAGIQPDAAEPGFQHVVLAPNAVAGLDRFEASYRAPAGLIRSRWERANGKVAVEVEVPTGTTATLLLPGAAPEKLPAGTHQRSFQG